jgi:amphi-Trp domain-containing protein
LPRTAYLEWWHRLSPITLTHPEEIMSDKKKLVCLEETRLAYMAGLLLKEVAAGLSKRQFVFETEDGPVTVTVPKDVEIEYTVEQKEKDGAAKTKLEIEISWKS